MSSSTIFIKRPLNYRKSLAVLREKYKELSPVLGAVMWTISGFYAAAQSNFNANLTGVTLEFPVYQILLMVISSVLLCKGLVDRNIIMIMPWITVSAIMLYFNHYNSLLNTLNVVMKVKKITWLPWTNLLVNILLIVIRVTLTIRVFQLCIHLWFKKKLKEMKENQF